MHIENVLKVPLPFSVEHWTAIITPLCQQTDVKVVVDWFGAGHLHMVKFLLEQGADLEHKTDEMHTALMEASMDGHVDVARYLLDRGAQVR